MQLGKSENLNLPTQPDAKHKSEMDRLSTMSGNAFDAAYMQHMVQDHQKPSLISRSKPRAGAIRR